MRLIIYSVLIFIAYSFLRNLFQGSARRRSMRNAHPAPPYLDDMVQCSVCDTFVPQSQAIVKTVRGKRYVFCGTACEADLKL